MASDLKVGALFQRGEDEVWLGFVPSIRGAFAQGDSLDECREKLRDAVESLLRYAPTDDLEDLQDSQVQKASAELLDISAPEAEERDDLLSQAAIARLAGVTRQAVNRWVKARKDFPASAGRSGAGPVWKEDEVLRWLVAANREPGHPPKEVSPWKPWKHEGHMDVVLLCKMHIKEPSMSAQLTKSLSERLEAVTKKFTGAEAEILPLGMFPDSK